MADMKIPLKREKLFRFNLLFSYKTVNLKFELLGILILGVIWGAGGWLFIILSGHDYFYDFMPMPTFRAMFLLFGEERFWASVWASLVRVITGISIAGAIGIPVGLVTGFYPILKNITHAPTQLLRMISPLAWMPVALIVFTSFESAICFLIFIATVWPIILNTASGVASINPQWIRMAMNQGADDMQLFRTIVVPASMPAIMSSLRLALGVAWIVLVPAEFLGVASGLGYLINDARDTLEYDMLMAIIISIGILGFFLDKLLQCIQIAFLNLWKE